MKTAARIQLTRAYLQKLDLQNYLATGIVILIVAVSVFWMLFHVGGGNAVTLYANIMYGAASLVGAGCAFLTAYRARRGPVKFAFPHSIAWGLIGAGLLADSMGGFIFAYLAQTGNPNPEPSLSDAGFILFYPLVFAGLICMPTTMRFRIRTGLDALILTLCILGLSWFLAIGPAFVALKQSNPPLDLYTFAVSLSYPFWDMLLILAIVLLLLQRVETVLRPSLFMAASGIVSITWADTAYFYLTANHTYISGTTYIDPFWFAGSLMIGLSALYQYHTLAQRSFVQQSLPHPPPASQPNSDGGSQKTGSRLLDYLPRGALLYVPFVLVLALVIYLEIGGSPYAVAGDSRPIRFFMVLLAAIVGILIVLRYLLVTRENEILLHEREQRQQNADRLRYAAAELSNILDLDGLLEHIVTLATTELSFDAAMLMLIDEYDNPFETSNRLLVRCSSNPVATVNLWHFHDDKVMEYAILAGKELVVTWEEEHHSLPQEIADWHRRQGISTTLFVPLTFQEKIQGSIGFSSYTSGLDQPSSTMARNYAGHAGRIIEHARLYQRTLEREMFAKAMANIAARLNAALIEPGEVYQLICSEGAAALQADYAVLYGYSSERCLQPLAVYAYESEALAQENAWPLIFPGDAEAQALSFLQPAVMNVDAPSNHYLFAFPSPSIQVGDTISSTSPRLPAAKAMIPYLRSALRQKLLDLAVHRAIVAPLIAKDNVLGLLILGRSQPAQVRDKKPFSTGDLEHTQDFAEQVVVALTNALLYQGLETAHTQLKELDHLKDQFMITASHELRTPLTSVQGYIELLVQYGEAVPPDQQQDFLQKAQRSCDELVLLLSNIMDASQLDINPHMQLAHLSPVSVRPLIDTVITLIGPQLKQEHREMHITVPDNLTVQADEGRLRQVLVNLSSNALKYSPHGTPLAFAVRAISIDGSASIIISVRDWGNGIPPEAHEYLFERFVRLERDLNSPVRGSGLGLYIARRLIEAMHGRIWLESAGIPGEGSTFHIQLPAA